MTKRLLMLSATVAIFCLSAAAQTADEVIAKYLAARGGVDKIKAVQSVQITGKFAIAPGVEAPFVLRLKRPNSMRMDFTVQGMTVTQAYDGQSGWQVMPLMGKSDPEPLTGDDLKEAAQDADIDGPLIDYKAKGHQVELAGQEDVGGSPAYKLKVTLKSGDVEYRYIDAKSYLEVKQSAKRTSRGNEAMVEETLGDYRSVDGIMFPYSLESSAQGSQDKQKIAVEKIELNTQVDAALFKMPETKPAEAKPPEQKPTGEKPSNEKPASPTPQKP